MPKDAKIDQSEDVFVQNPVCVISVGFNNAWFILVPLFLLFK